MLNQEIINFANELADASEAIAKKYFRLPNGEIIKDDESPVTKADREIEEALRQMIEKKFPDHGIIGEEHGIKNPQAEYKWILDPIDGTSSFIIGRPTFGTLIALTKGEKTILGIVNQPITNERWIGTENSDSIFNGKKISTRKTSLDLREAVLCTTSPFYFKNDDAKKFQELSSKTKYQNCGGVIYGGDCYLYTLLASGFIDLVIDCGLKVYDYAALIPIIEGAGGVITDWQGNDLKLNSNVKVLAAANKEIHQKALGVLR